MTFTSEDRVRDLIRNFNADGFGSLYPKYRGGRPPKFTLGQRREIKKVAKAKPAGAKGTYIQRVAVSSTMGPGVKVEPGSLLG